MSRIIVKNEYLAFDHFCIHSDLWESYTLGIFPCINLFVNVFFSYNLKPLTYGCGYYIKRQNWCLQQDAHYPLPFSTIQWSLVGHGIYLSSLELIVLDWLSTIKCRKATGLHSHSNIYNVFFLNQSTILGSGWNSATYYAWWLALI